MRYEFGGRQFSFFLKKLLWFYLMKEITLSLLFLKWWWLGKQNYGFLSSKT
jgi:hypothetical protein